MKVIPVYFVVDQSVSHLSVTPWTAAHQASLSITNSRRLLKLICIELVIFILCHPLLLLPSVFPSIRVFSSESVLCIRWPKYQSFSISPSINHFIHLHNNEKFLLFRLHILILTYHLVH